MSSLQNNKAGMSKRFVDLSIAIEPGLPSDPPGMIPEIEYVSHQRGADAMKFFFPGLKTEDLPEGLGWAVENVKLNTHSGTHLDAPWHYHPTMDNGSPSLTIDQVPLEWCYGPGVKLDFSGKPAGHLLQPDDFKAQLDKIGHRLAEGEIVLVQSGAAPYWGKPEYLMRGCGAGRAATLWLLEQGIKVVGTDAWSWDRPLPKIAEEYKRTGNPKVIWEGHFAGIEKGYCHLEKLANLDKLPDKGFQFICFPVKIKAASAGWVRAVAVLGE
jgi:kynurenine formamidase